MADTAPYFERNPREYLGAPHSGWRLRLFAIIFESDTRAGRLFDLALLCLIVLSVAAVMLDNVASVTTQNDANRLSRLRRGIATPSNRNTAQLSQPIRLVV